MGKLDKLPEGTTIDAAEEMIQATLTVISRAMFCLDAEELVAVAQRYRPAARPVIIRSRSRFAHGTG
jgi:hypothetical protein